jgi:hypothetical protein
LQLRKFYDEVELITDRYGHGLLIDKMELPYTNVRVEMDVLNEYHPQLYAIGKIFAYSLQDKPFLHVDSDVFIWERFRPELEKSSLICQNIENGAYYNRWYLNVFLEMAKNLDQYPHYMDGSINKNGCIVSLNAGILGGNDIGFFREFTREARAFVDNNAHKLSGIRVDLFNCIYEQFLAYAMAEARGVPIACYNPDFTEIWTNVMDFTGVPRHVKYIHAVGKLKKTRSVVEAMEDRLEMDYPDQYFRIMNLLRTNQI